MRINQSKTKSNRENEQPCYLVFQSELAPCTAKLVMQENTTLTTTVKPSNNIFNNSFIMEDIKATLLEAVVDSKTVKMCDLELIPKT